VAYASFGLIMQALVKGEIDGGVFAIENTLNGGVMQNIDLLQDTEGVVAVKEYLQKIDHRLVTKKGADISKITCVYSHQQALGQCAKFLNTQLPHAKLCATPSTAACLQNIKTPFDAGIVGSQCDVGDLEKSHFCIADERENYTQFLLVKKQCIKENTTSNKIYFSFTCKHEAGALVKLLQILSKSCINMTKIESRPIKDKLGEYRFFIETEADFSSPNVQSALKKIQEKANSLKILGVY
jgi:prephenate dehydratase